MKNQDNTLIYALIALLVIILLGGSSMMRFGGMGGMMGYGNNYLCSNAGGIWCYFPIFGFILMVIFWIVIILLIIYIIKQIQKPRRRK